MKKFILSLLCIFAVTASAQSNYAGSSKFTDNWSVTLQGGVVTSFSQFYSSHTACAPIIVVGADKYFTPWFGVGVEGRTLIGTGKGIYNTHTAFDNVNVSGYAKFNIANMFKYDGRRHLFEPVIYTGLGWGHQTCSTGSDRNFMTYRAGAEFTFNLGKTRAWGIVVNPSVVWGDIDNGKLYKSHGYFEATAGVVYHFKNSNGTHSFGKIDVVALNNKINDLRAKNRHLKHDNARLAEELQKKPKEIVNTVREAVPVDNSYTVSFKKGSSEVGNVSALAEALKQTDGKITIIGNASPEGTEAFNKKLAEARANAVKNALVKAGVDESRITVVSGYEQQRRATVTVEK